MMKKSNKKRLRNSAFITLVALMLCVFATIGVTYALFTDRVDTENKINAGTLKISATHTITEGYETDANGQVVAYNEVFNTNLSDSTESVFTIENAQPTVWQTATFKVENKDTVSFNYNVRIVNLTDADGNAILATSADEALSQQLKVTILGYQDATVTEVQKTFMLSECADIANVVEFGELLAGKDSAFAVTVEFVNIIDSGDEFEQGTTNNKAQNGGVKFDIQITAVQSTTAATAPDYRP
jgi:predicted ribosomally synthesized peptide with SipW-like signal peptide